MVAHRKNVPPPPAHVPSSWFIVLTVMVVIGGAGWLGWLVLDDDSATEASSNPSAGAPATTPTPAPETTDSATPDDETPDSDTPDDETPEPTATPDEPATQRTATVSVLNNSGVAGAARTFSGKVTSAGWTLGGVGNWTGSIEATTVYYPPSLQAQAELLAADVDIDRVRPSVSPMRPDRLTIILSGPQ